VASRLNRGATSGTVLPYSWDPHRPARVGVLPRDGGPADLRWLDVEPCYVYHPVNAYDDGPGRIVVEVPRHASAFSTPERSPGGATLTMDRWTLDVPAGKVIEERLDDASQEFPRIDERLVGRRHRYAWTVTFDPDAAVAAVIKHDFASGRSDRREFGAGTIPNEFVFVPASADAGEDEGVVMGYVYDGATDRSRLEVLDAGTLETVATVGLPARVPHGFHGSWIPTSPTA
jgi:carotenoid cleavage dioxygenase